MNRASIDSNVVVGEYFSLAHACLACVKPSAVLVNGCSLAHSCSVCLGLDGALAPSYFANELLSMQYHMGWPGQVTVGTRIADAMHPCFICTCKFTSPVGNTPHQLKAVQANQHPSRPIGAAPD